MSASRLNRITRIAKTNVTAMITGVSFARIALMRRDPMPGTRKICSVTIAPPKIAGIWSATSVTTGMSAFLSACFTITVLGLFQAAGWTRYVRSATLDVIRLDYVTTARSKGLRERAIILKHVVRNALIPVVTLVALTMPQVFGGAIVTEQIFRVPGIGSLLIDAILRNDTPVIMAVTFVFSCLVILFNLIADMLYGWLDPRISYR